MSIINKLIGNPLIIAILISVLVVFVTIIPTIYCKKSYKYQTYMCSIVFLLLSITILLVAYQYCNTNKFTGASEIADYSNIFNIPTQFNQF